MKAMKLAGAALVVLTCASSAFTIAEESAAADPPAETVATCIKVRPEARYLGLGYNHIVHVADVCGRAAECDVSTDVNPQKTHVSVSAHDEVEVNTFLGSPARVFTPKVDCTLAKR